MDWPDSREPLLELVHADIETGVAIFEYVQADRGLTVQIKFQSFPTGVRPR